MSKVYQLILSRTPDLSKLTKHFPETYKTTILYFMWLHFFGKKALYLVITKIYLVFCRFFIKEKWNQKKNRSEPESFNASFESKFFIFILLKAI